MTIGTKIQNKWMPWIRKQESNTTISFGLNDIITPCYGPKKEGTQILGDN